MGNVEDKQPAECTTPDQRAGRGVTTLTLCAILLLAGVLRLQRLDLIEFKTDEAKICNLAIQMLDEKVPATHGLTSGAGVANFPLFVWLLAIPIAFSYDPIVLTALVALCNLVAIGLIFLLAARRWGLPVALWTALLMACSPWAVLYSRKIWAQNVLPLIMLFALFGLLRLLDGQRRRIFDVTLAVGVAAMIHFSGFAAGVATLFCLVLFRPRLRWRRLGLAALILAVLAAPYAYYQITEGAADRELLRDYLAGEGTAEGLAPSLLEVTSTSLNIINDFGIGHILGDAGHEEYAHGALSVGGVIGRGTLIAALFFLLWRTVQLARRRGRGDQPAGSHHPRDAAVLLIWMLVPVVVYWLADVRVPTHYFIVVLPAPFVALGLLLEQLRYQARRIARPALRQSVEALPIALGLGLAVAGAVATLAFTRTIDCLGGAPGDYGVALKHKSAAIDHILLQAGDQPVMLAGDFGGRTPLPAAEDFDYLLRHRRGRSGGTVRTDVDPIRFTIIDEFRFRLTTAQLEFVGAFAPRQFGPLIVCDVTPDPNRKLPKLSPADSISIGQ